MLFELVERQQQLSSRAARGRGILHIQKFNVENQLRLRRNLPAPQLAIRKLIRNEQTPLAADLHTLKADVPTWDHLPAALHELQRIFAHRGIELRSIAQPAGIVDRKLL